MVRIFNVIGALVSLASFSKISTDEQKNTGLKGLVLNVLNLVSNFKQRQCDCVKTSERNPPGGLKGFSTISKNPR